MVALLVSLTILALATWWTSTKVFKLVAIRKAEELR